MLLHKIILPSSLAKPPLPLLRVGDYEYDVRVKACAGTSSSSATAYFCSNSLCDGTIGEEQSVLLEMNDVEGGWTDISFPLSFNPLGMRLEEAEGDVEW